MKKHLSAVRHELQIITLFSAFFLSVGITAFGQIPNYVPSNGLVGWWPFNGNANDLSGNNLNGSVTGATLTTDRNGVANSCYNFNYTNWSWGSGGDEIYIPYNALFNTSNLTVSVWVNRASSGYTNQQHTIINRYQYGYSNPNGQTWQILAGSAPNCNISTVVIQAAPNNSQAVIFHSGPNLELNNWTNIVLTFDGLSKKQYVNGVLVATVPANGLLLNTAGNSGISVGVSDQANGHWGPFDGKIDDIGLWNRALSACEVSALYTGQQINAPTVELGADTMSICGLNTALDATNPAAGSYSWNTGDTTSTINISNSGEYTVTVTDTVGCSASDMVYVSIIDPTLTAGSSAFCLGDSTEIQLISGITNSIDTVLANQFTMTFGSAFNYTTPTTILGNQYLLKVQGDYTIWGCCTASGTGSPRIDGAYYFSTNGSDQPYKRINWCWNGVTPVLDTTLFRPDNDIYQSNHTYWFSFIGDGLPQNFCFSDNSYSDNNGSLNFEIFEIQNIQSNLSIWWSDGTTNQNSIQVQPTQTTTYSVTVSDGVGSCTDSITIQVNNPQINAGNNLSVCTGDSLTLTATGANTYGWDNGIVNGQAFLPTIEGYYTVVGTDTLGCSNSDSLFLDLLQPTASNIERIACDTYTAPDGNVYTISGQYIAIIPNAEGCDSTIQLALTVNNSSASNQTTAELDSYTWPVNGQTYTQSGVYTAVIQNSKGCDSTITLNLSLEFSGISELNGKEIVITPNPVDASFTLIADSKYIGNEYVLTNQQGAIVGKGTIRATKMEVNCGHLAKGIYLFQINSTDQHVIRVMKN